MLVRLVDERGNSRGAPILGRVESGVAKAVEQARWKCRGLVIDSDSRKRIVKAFL